MLDAYAAKIEMSKRPKAWTKVSHILSYLKIGIQKEYDTRTMCEKLNEFKVKTLTGEQWNMSNLQMQILFMSRLDNDSTLGRGWAYLMRTGEVTAHDMQLLQDRFH